MPTKDVNNAKPGPSDPQFWEQCYRDNDDRWELGAPSPPLARALSAAVSRGPVLVLGCGRGHEARLLADLGFERVVAVDFAPTAIAEARRLSTGRASAERIEWRIQDLFSVGRTDPGTFEVVLEHTCFCAIDPGRRAEWAQVVSDALRPGGRLVALFYAHGRPGGPPFTTTRDEVEEVLRGAGLTVEAVEVPEDSVERRRGLELLVVARRP